MFILVIAFVFFFQPKKKIWSISNTLNTKNAMTDTTPQFVICQRCATLLFVCACLLSGVQLCNPMDCSPPGSSVHGILQARILEWAAISSSRNLPNPGIELISLESSALAGGFFTTVLSGKPIAIFISNTAKVRVPSARPSPLPSRGFSEPMSLADEKFSLMKVRYSDAGGRWPGCFPYNDTDVDASHVFSSFYYLNTASWQGTVQFGAVFEMNISGWFLHYILWSLPFFTQYCVLEMSFLFVRCNRRDLSSQTRSQTHACCNGSTES